MILFATGRIEWIVECLSLEKFVQTSQINLIFGFSETQYVLSKFWDNFNQQQKSYLIISNNITTTGIKTKQQQQQQQQK